MRTLSTPIDMRTGWALAPRRCPNLSCVERYDDVPSRELLTVRTVPTPQS